MSEKTISIVVPARNEEALLGQTLDAILAAVAASHLSPGAVEIIVVDNASTDRTAAVARRYRDRGVVVVSCEQVKAPCARNFGARASSGRILVFVDADTMMPEDTLGRVLWLVDNEGYEGGFTRLASLEGGMRAWWFWTLFEHVRALPSPRCKAMSALMFCTRAVFDEFNGFNDAIELGEEWQVLGGLYGARPQRFVYDRTLTALTSSRRMELQPLGYTRTLLQYLWAVVHPSGRLRYTDKIRHSYDQAA